MAESTLEGSLGAFPRAETLLLCLPLILYQEFPAVICPHTFDVQQLLGLISSILTSCLWDVIPQCGKNDSLTRGPEGCVGLQAARTALLHLPCLGSGSPNNSGEARAACFLERVGKEVNWDLMFPSLWRV